MNLAWQSIKLSHALIKSDEWIEVDPSQTYQQVTVKMWGKGVELRNNVLGSTIAASKRLQVHPEQFILSRIDARHGAFGLIPESLDRALVTNDFPVFNLNRELLLPEFLNWLSKTGNFVDICRMASEGTTNRVRLKEDKFLSTEIRLPPIAEQRRIVARIEELAAKIEEARGLREGAIEECDTLCRSIIFSEAEKYQLTPMLELVHLRDLDVEVSPLESYTFAGVYSFGRGVFKQHSLMGTEFSYKNLTKLKAGNFVYPKLMAWEGALGSVPEECDGLVVSPEFPVFEVNENKVLPETLDVYFRTPSIWSKLAEISAGTNIRRRRLHPSKFLQFEMPLPNMETQQKLREVKAKTELMKNERQKSLTELNALLPAILDKAFKGEL